MNLVPISASDLILAGLALFLMGLTSTALQLGIGSRLWIATIRMVAQLLVLGYLLETLFSATHGFWVLLMAMVMTAVAGREVVARSDRKLRGFTAFFIGTGSMGVAAFAVTVFALTVVVNPTPWYAPRYAIPLLGMLLGNTMNAVAIAIERLTEGVWKEREMIEQRLALGESAREATADLRRLSIRAGLIPTVNAMAVSGIVSLPGMMTGQILAGSPPEEAVRYQILIWMFVATGSGFGAMLGTTGTLSRLFDNRERLRIERLTQPKAATPVRPH